jgi:hypothetical protein
MFMFHGDPPRAEMAAALPGLAGVGFRLAGRALLRDYPYQEAYLLPLARQFREALTLPLILLGGISSLASIQRTMAEGFDFVAMDRALLREPDLVARLAAGCAPDSPAGAHHEVGQLPVRARPDLLRQVRAAGREHARDLWPHHDRGMPADDEVEAARPERQPAGVRGPHACAPPGREGALRQRGVRRP